MSKFKVGDRVRILNDGNGYPTYEHWPGLKKATNWTRNNLVTAGGIYTITHMEKHGGMGRVADKLALLTDKNGKQYIFGLSDPVGNLEKVEGADMYEVGDVLIDDDGNERMVLALSGNLVALSPNNMFDDFNSWYILENLKESWKLKDTTEPKEMTVKQVSEALGHDVKIVKE